MQSLFLDFEFSRTVEPVVNLVCCTTLEAKSNLVKEWWLHNDKASQNKLKSYLEKFDIIIGYSTVAEARSFMALGLNPLDTKWIDLFIEYRMITNHNDELQWGKQLVDGRVITAKKPRPKWERTEGETESGFKATHSLAEATYKLTGEIRDTEEKTKMRDLIISDPKSFTSEERKAIMAYNSADVVFLPRIWNEIKRHYKKLVPFENINEYFKEAILRGRYSAHTALMESMGYPIDVEKTKNFSRQVGNILYTLQKEINELFPGIKPFRYERKTSKYAWDQKATRKWIEENCNTTNWMKTDKGQLSLSLEAFEKVFPFKHTYPTDNFGAQMVRFLKLKQSLYGFSDSGGKRKNFWDSVGSDGRVRPYMNHYGAQSSRSQPAASGFMFLKPAWMRALVVPPKGKFMASIDYGQQEFFIAALESKDKAMINAYLSGDPYLYGAKLAGAIPKDGTKETHSWERNLYKNTYLGILYGMTKVGLSQKLSNDMGKEVDEDFAQELIDTFSDTFPDYMSWKEEITHAYYDNGGVVLPCGWRMFGDNENPRSVNNVPVQGFGASVMRKSVDLAVAKGCKISFTLHDANYIEDTIGNEIMIKNLADAMREAFVFYCDPADRKYAEQIKLHPYAWSPEYKKDSEIKIADMIVPCSNLYIDARAEEEYKKFSKFFNNPDTDLL